MENVRQPPMAPNRSAHTRMNHAMLKPNVAIRQGFGVSPARRCRHKTMLDTDPIIGTAMQSGLR